MPSQITERQGTSDQYSEFRTQRIQKERDQDGATSLNAVITFFNQNQ